MKFLGENKRGFTLAEVMIGMMILTIAIVSATNLLVSLRKSNEANFTTLQAYYFAVEGLEGVRNIRDTNWLHNRDWLGANSQALWGEDLRDEGAYNLSLNRAAFAQGPSDESVDGQLGLMVGTWSLVSGVEQAVSDVNGELTDFKRTIYFEKLPNEEDKVLVKSEVKWDLKGDERKVLLSEILTNWKDGVF